MKTRIVFEMIQDLLVSAVLTFCGGLLNGIVMPLKMFIPGMLFAWVVNLVIGFSVPEKKLGDKLCDRLGLQGRGRFWIVMAVIVTINVIGISLCVNIRRLGFTGEAMKIFLVTLIPLLLLGYAAACLFYPLSEKLSGMICGINKGVKKDV